MSTFSLQSPPSPPPCLPPAPHTRGESWEKVCVESSLVSPNTVSHLSSSFSPEGCWEDYSRFNQAVPKIFVSTSLRFMFILNSPGSLGSSLGLSGPGPEARTPSLPTTSHTSLVFTGRRLQHGALSFWRSHFSEPSSRLAHSERAIIPAELHPCSLFWFTQILGLWPAGSLPLHMTETSGIRPTWVQIPPLPLLSCVFLH